MISSRQQIRVLVVDDSAVVRKVLREQLSCEEDICVVGTAVDPFAARDKILRLSPDVVTLDIEMPRMDGLTFLERLMRYHPLPVVIVSSLSPKGGELAVRALELGAIDVITKPGSPYEAGEIAMLLAEKIRIAARARTFASPKSREASRLAGHTVSTRTSQQIVAIGASTGGTTAIQRLLQELPPACAGVVIVQHMPAGFTHAFAKRLNESSAFEVREARTGDPLASGTALIAPGDKHLVLRRSGARYSVEVKDGPRIHHQRPSVDVLFHSVAREVGRNAVGVLLTGMGVDGAAGLLAMRDRGAATYAQDEATSVVFGMPKEAIALGAAEEIVPLPRMAQRIAEALSRRDAPFSGASSDPPEVT